MGRNGVNTCRNDGGGENKMRANESKSLARSSPTIEIQSMNIDINELSNQSNNALVFSTKLGTLIFDGIDFLH